MCDGLGCVASAVGDTLDAMGWWGGSYGFALPSIGLGIAGSSFMGRGSDRLSTTARRRMEIAGVALLLGGAVAWAIPRLAFAVQSAYPESHWITHRLYGTLDATFYASYTALTAGGSLLAYVEGGREASRARRIEAALSPSGLFVSGRF